MPISVSRPRWWPALVWAGAVLPALAGLDGRIPITQRDLVAPPLVITNAGSYVVASPLVVDANEGVGIRVAADHVTLDFNGFALLYQGTNAVAGIQQTAGYRNLTVRNGIVSGWKGSNYSFTAGISALGDGNRFERLLLTENNNGLRTGRGAKVFRCAATQNAIAGLEAAEADFEECSACSNASGGYFIASAGTAVGCVALGNGFGFRVGGVDFTTLQVYYGNTALRHCVAAFNSGDGMLIGRDAVVRACLAIGNIAGFNVETNGIISRCFGRTNESAAILVKDNGQVTDSLAAGNWRGIVGNFRGAITRSSSSGNREFGIMVGNSVSSRAGAGVIRDCIAAHNRTGAEMGKGIYAEGIGSRVEGNHAILNGYGLVANLIFSGSNLVVRNSAVNNNYTNYYLGSGVTAGPVQDSLDTPYPWANLTY